MTTRRARALVTLACLALLGAIAARTQEKRAPADRVEIPVALQNLSPEQAEGTLRDLGLDPCREYRRDPRCSAETLLSLEPPAGSTVPRGSQVLLVIAAPPLTDRGANAVAWTTDVGPDAPADVAAKMLDFLRARGVHATFFVCGAWAQRHPQVLRRLAAEGHHLGNHTFHHRHLLRVPSEEIAEEIRRTEEAVVRVVGLQPMLPRVFRPPYGEENGRVRAIVAGEGYRDVRWDIDPLDWDPRRSPERIAAFILQRAAPGRIILTHVEPRTLQAMPAIFDGLRGRGLTPSSLRECMGGRWSRWD